MTYEDAIEESESQEPTAEDIAWYLRYTYEDCIACGGNGEFYRANYGWNAAEPYTYLGSCGECDGTGAPRGA